MQTFTLLGNAKKYSDLGKFFGYNLYQREVEYLVDNEWVNDIEALIWRRTKLGLWLNKDEIKSLEHWLKNYLLKTKN